jgi:hypothetical protein
MVLNGPMASFHTTKLAIDFFTGSACFSLQVYLGMLVARPPSSSHALFISQSEHFGESSTCGLFAQGGHLAEWRERWKNDSRRNERTKEG